MRLRAAAILESALEMARLRRLPQIGKSPSEPKNASRLVAVIAVATATGVASALVPSLALGSLLIAVVAAGFFRLVVSGDIVADRSFLLYIFLAAVAIRLLIAVSTYKLLPYGFFAPDEDEYSSYGANLATIGLPSPVEAVQGARGWFYFNALVTQFFGNDARLLMRFWNSAVGSLVPLLCYRLTAMLAGRPAARLTAIFATVCPSLVLWSSLNLKDTDTHALILGSIQVGLAVQRTRRVRYLIPLAPMLIMTAGLRQYLVIPLVAAVLVAQLVPRRDFFGNLFLVVIVGGVLLIPLILSIPDLATWSPRITNLENLGQYRQGFASGAGSAYLGQQSFDSPFAVVTFLPTAMFYFLLGPFPWSSGTVLQTLAAPEMILYYLLIPFVVIGIRRSIVTRASVAIPLLVFAAIVIVSYSLTISNFGAVFRFRDQLLIVVLCFGAIGLRWKRDRAQKPATRQASPATS